MWNRLGSRAVATILIAWCFLGACGPKAVTEDIKIGSILGLTGDNSAYGKKMLRGFELAREDINSSGGISGRKVILVIEDSQFDPTKAVNAYKKLTSIDGVKFIVGVTGSKNAIPVCEDAADDDVVIVDALSSAPSITSKCGTNYFRVMASDALAGKFNAAWAAESGARRVAIVHMDDEWGTSYRDALTGYLNSAGLTLVAAEPVKADARDFRTEIEKIRSAAPDALFLLLYAKLGAGFMQQMREATLNPTVYGSDNISSPEFVSVGVEVVEGVRVAMPAPTTGDRYVEFASRYREKFGEELDANVVKSYDALMLTASALRPSGDFSPAQLKSRLSSPEFQYQGISGLIRFDTSGDLREQDYSKMVYKQGRMEPIE